MGCCWFNFRIMDCNCIINIHYKPPNRIETPKPQPSNDQSHQSQIPLLSETENRTNRSNRGNDYIPSGQPKPLETPLKKTHEARDQKLNDGLPLTYYKRASFHM